MGTRHLVCVVQDGDFKVANYGQWDGYPGGQGESIRQFLIDPELDMERFRTNVKACRFFTEEDTKDGSVDKLFGEQRDKLDRKLSAMGYKDWNARAQVQLEDWTRPDSLTYLSRDLGADILRVVYAAPRSLTDSRSFAGDGLFCEWAYVIDLDNNALEVYEGFNTDGPVDNRFAFLNPDPNKPFEPRYDGDERYYPPKLLVTIPFSELPGFSMGSLVEDEDEEEGEE